MLDFGVQPRQLLAKRRRVLFARFLPRFELSPDCRLKLLQAAAAQQVRLQLVDQDIDELALVPQRSTNPQRPALWVFERVDTIRRAWLQRAGRLTTPAGKLTLTFCVGKQRKERILQLAQALAE